MGASFLLPPVGWWDAQWEPCWKRSVAAALVGGGEQECASTLGLHCGVTARAVCDLLELSGEDPLFQLVYCAQHCQRWDWGSVSI